mgnify:CR=1 FL=1
MMQCSFEAISEDLPGARWKAVFDRHWPSYRNWYLQDGARARPTFLACRRALRTHMPELAPLWEQLVDLTGGGDVEARFLSLWCPPPFIAGCAQAVWMPPRDSSDAPVLLRNYDYSPALIEGTWLQSRWSRHSVIAMVDCLWGVLDGINEHGLAVSLSFGGRTVVGDGFGVPLVLRYLLETCSTVRDAVAALQRIPLHMAYNVALLDAQGDWCNAFLGPDRTPEFVRQAAVTNHQERVDWPAHARATLTEERQAVLAQSIKQAPSAEAMLRQMLRPPVFQTSFARGYGTLYTAMYTPTAGTAELVWQDARWFQSHAHFREGGCVARYGDSADAPLVAVQRTGIRPGY